MTMKLESREIIDRLLEEYKDDPEALEEIERRIIDIEYVERKEAVGGYDGQPSIGHAMMLEDFLHTWY